MPKVRTIAIDDIKKWADSYLKTKDNHPEPSEVMWVIGDLIKYLDLYEKI